MFLYFCLTKPRLYLLYCKCFYCFHLFDLKAGQSSAAPAESVRAAGRLKKLQSLMQAPRGHQTVAGKEKSTSEDDSEFIWMMEGALLCCAALLTFPAPLQITWQTCWATATLCWPALDWERGRRRHPKLLHRLSSRLVKTPRRKGFGAHGSGIICGARLSVPSPGLLSITPVSSRVMNCGCAAAPCHCPGQPSGTASRAWYRSWTARALTCRLHKPSTDPSQMCSSPRTT